MRTDRPVLVTGATGRRGGTGRHVVAHLIDAGIPVRALVRGADERAEALRGMGTDVVVGDFTDYTSLLAALDGVEAAYFSYPVGAGLAQAAGLFAAAGREQGLRRIVDLSLDAAFPESPSPQGRANWVAERIFEWAGFGGTHLRVAAFFMENLLSLYGRTVRETGEVRNSFGDFKASWIAAADVGAIAALMLADPAAVTDRTTVVGGTQRADHAAIAEIISAVTGRPARYTSLTPEQWREELLANAGGEPDSTAAGHLSAQSVELRRRDTHVMADDVQRLTGRRAVTIEDFIERNRETFMPAQPIS